MWYDVQTTSSMMTRYWVSWEADPGAVVIQILSPRGAVVRHLFPRGTVESVTSSTPPGDGGKHLVCINPTFLVDSVVFEFGSAEDALMFHWRVAQAMV
jgi:hypothetical protein